MVVQTFRMKIQESPLGCDSGGSGQLRGADPDKPSCEDVPRLDLTALTEDNSWGGEAILAIVLLFSRFFLHHMQDKCILNRSYVGCKHTHAMCPLHPALHMAAWAAVAHCLLQLLPFKHLRI